MKSLLACYLVKVSWVAAEILFSPGFRGEVIGQFPDPLAGTRNQCLGWAGSPCGCQCAIEFDEWLTVDALVKTDDVVIEWGARYGTTSCRLAQATNNSGNVFSVEPDVRAYNNLIKNRQHHHCNFHIIQGVVSDGPLAMGTSLGLNAGYSQRTVSSASEHSLMRPNHKLSDLETIANRKVNVALIDCEGCIKHCLSIPGILEQLDLILLEEDMSVQEMANTTKRDKNELVNYDKDWYSRFQNAGFRQIWRSHGTAGYRHSGPSGAWPNPQLHSAWAKSSRLVHGHVNACRHHARTTGLPKHLLNCAHIPKIRR